MALSVLMMVCVSACSGNAETVDENHDSSAIISESEDIEAESKEETIISEDSETYRTEEDDNQAAENNTSFDETDIGGTTMIMKIGDTKVNVDWEDNQAVYALRNMVEKGDVTITISKG